MQRSGVRVVHRLDHYGILGSKTIAAHCIHVDESELDRLAETGTWITHQPRSNMNNGVGAMAFDTMMARGMNVCLGNDGFSNNMWADWKAAYLLHKLAHRDPRRANGADVARMAVENNARLLDVFFPGAAGRAAGRRRARRPDLRRLSPVHAADGRQSPLARAVRLRGVDGYNHAG